MQFISVNSTGEYIIDSNAKQVLSSMTGPLTVVSVIGRYRTGKSSLLNGLTGASTFQTSSTVQAQTKGIMIHKLNEHTLLMDTEGLGSLDVSRDHDASIFALAMLVSSGCFFNNLGGITSQAVDDLHLATKVASLLCKHAKFNKHLPDLVWIMRDFTLDLCDRNGLPISADVYFEQCIEKCAVDKCNDIRSLFPSRRCVPLSRPTLEETDLRSMTNLRPEFVEGIEHIHSLVRNFKPKAVGGKNLTGEQLCAFTESLCHVLNSSAVPNLEDVWQLVAAQSKQCALGHTRTAFANAPSMLEGLSAAYDTYTQMILDETVSGEEIYKILYALVQSDTRGHEWEEKYVEAKQAFDVLVATSSTQLKESEAQSRDHDSNMASAHRKVARLVDEGLVLQLRLKELELVVPRPESESTTELIDVLEGLQVKHKELKLELAEKRRTLDDVVQTIHTQDRTISEHASRLLAERKTIQDQRVKFTELESCISDLKSSLHQSTTDVAIWRTRYEDTVSRNEKKRKMNDDTYTDLIALTSEVNFLRNRHEEDAKRLQKHVAENAVCAQQVQMLQVKLALEIGK